MKKRVSSSTPGYPAKMKLKVLAIDDDEGIRDILKIIFEKAGYSIELKSGGKDIYQNKFTVPDLFLIDKQLSGMNGLDICMHLKNQANTRHIPVIMISASPDIAKLSNTAGADDYIEKPFDISYLLRIVYDFTHLQENPAVSPQKLREMHHQK